MIEEKVVITNSTGLHARPAAVFVQAAKRYTSKIRIATEQREADAKSILGVLSMGAVKGTTLTIRADGPDERDAVTGLAAAIVSGLGEA